MRPRAVKDFRLVQPDRWPSLTFRRAAGLDCHDAPSTSPAQIAQVHSQAQRRGVGNINRKSCRILTVVSAAPGPRLQCDARTDSNRGTVTRATKNGTDHWCDQCRPVCSVQEIPQAGTTRPTSLRRLCRCSCTTPGRKPDQRSRCSRLPDCTKTRRCDRWGM